MKNRFNPFYAADRLGLEMLSFDEPGTSGAFSFLSPLLLCYEFNTLCFWATNDGRVYSASDSGCSCPTPFEDYEGATQEEVLQKLERVGSPEQAASIFASWNRDGRDNQKLPKSEELNAVEWVKGKLANVATPKTVADLSGGIVSVHVRLRHAIEELDAAVFSTDIFYTPNNIEILQGYLDRWGRELAENKKLFAHLERA